MSLAIDRQGIIDAVARGRRACSTRRCRPRSRTGRSRSTSSARAPSTSSTIPPAAKQAAGRGRPSRTGFQVTIDFTTYGSHGPHRRRAARPQEPEGRRHRGQARPQGVRRLHLEHLLRQVRRRWPSGRRRRSSSPTTSSTASTIPGRSRTTATSTTRCSPTCSSASGAPSTSPSGARSSTRSSATSPSSSTTCSSGPACTSAVWDGALKNYGPNLGYDYGGRLMAAWLDR